MTSKMSTGTEPRRQLRAPLDVGRSRQLGRVLDQIRDDGPALAAAPPAPIAPAVTETTAQVIDHPDRARLTRQPAPSRARFPAARLVVGGLFVATLTTLGGALWVIQAQQHTITQLQATLQMLTGERPVGLESR